MDFYPEYKKNIKIQLNNKDSNLIKKKWAKGFDNYFTKDIQMAK